MSSTASRIGRVIAVVALVAIAAGAAAQPDTATLQQHAKEGERALAEGRYGDAEQAYETLRKLSPGTAEVHARLGLIYFQQGKFKEAVPRLRDAIRLKPGLPKTDALLAMSLSELGQYDEALPALTKAFAQQSDPVLRRMAGLHLQRAYTGLRRDQDAVDVALRLSRLHPDDPEVLYHTGRLFANYAYLQTMKLAEVAPGSVWLHQAAGEANESTEMYDAAVREYREALALSPRRPGLHFRLGRAFLGKSEGGARAEDVEEARKAFEKELEIDPTNANAAYELAEMARKAGDFARAREYFERALTYYPEFEDAQVGLGRTLVALGEPARALPHLQAAIKRNADNEVAQYQLATAYRALGKTAEQERALAEYTRLRALGQQRGTIPLTKREVTPQMVDDKQ